MNETDFHRARPIGIYTSWARLYSAITIEIKLKDERLEKRWLFLVRSQMKVSSPLAAVEMDLKTGNGILSTRVGEVRDSIHLDQVLSTMQASLGWNLG